MADLSYPGQTITYTGPANFVEFLIGFRRALPYAESNALATDVNGDSTLSDPVKSSVTASLANGRSKMTKRDFSGAAASMRAAATTLRDALEVASLQDTAEWIATHVGRLASE
jgi:hypothetical protein